MAIKVVVNGYFRSGTTFIWRYLNDSLKGYVSFYEPLHKDLAALVQQAKKLEYQKNTLHNDYLWNEYLELDEETLKKLLINNPNLNDTGIANYAALKEYLNIFHKLKKKVMLQANRMHFFLDVAKDYNAKVIHIIRHPLDVFASMERVYEEDKKSKLRSTLKKMGKVYGFQKLNSFDLDKEFKWINKHIGYPTYSESFVEKYFKEHDYFGKFVVVWTISNYYALKNVEKNNGFWISYEEAVEKPERTFKKISKYLEIQYKESPKIKKKNSFKFRKKDLEKLKRKVKEYGIEEEFNYVINKVKERGINYL